jgi:hypothetical protein
MMCRGCLHFMTSRERKRNSTPLDPVLTAHLAHAANNFLQDFAPPESIVSTTMADVEQQQRTRFGAGAIGEARGKLSAM